MSHWLETYYSSSIGKSTGNPVLDLIVNWVNANGKNQVDMSKVTNYQAVALLLKKAGFPEDIIPFSTSQVIYETNGLISRVSMKDNNLSGITWINKPYQKATKGLKKPEGGYYAHFNNPGEWADDFRRIISMGGSNAPINAGDLKEYISRLHANGYFKQNPAIYYRNVAMILAAKDPLMKIKERVDKEIAREKKQDKEDKKNWWEKHPVAAGAVGLLSVILFIKVVNN